ncbi:hypothetical protein D5086_016810 [Populus alba]|uniref:Uncharacterized protein n=2 Tax=Populus TaxID=3689 RepID=A0ACC4BV36_POPAL|nr:hypothetical protein NC653_021436 [Populus alba x Populus x berolinensis]
MGYGYFGTFLIDTIKKKELLRFEQSTLFYWNPNGVLAADQLGMISCLNPRTDKNSQGHRPHRVRLVSYYKGAGPQGLSGGQKLV